MCRLAFSIHYIYKTTLFFHLRTVNLLKVQEKKKPCHGLWGAHGLLRLQIRWQRRECMQHFCPYNLVCAWGISEWQVQKEDCKWAWAATSVLDCASLEETRPERTCVTLISVTVKKSKVSTERSEDVASPNFSVTVEFYFPAWGAGVRSQIFVF